MNQQELKEITAIRDLAMNEWNLRLIATGRRPHKVGIHARHFRLYPKFLKDFLVSKGLWPRYSELRKKLGQGRTGDVR